MMILRKKSVCSIMFLLFLTACATTQKDTTQSIENNKEVPNLTQSSQNLRNVVVKEFVLGPGDEIAISVYRQDDLKGTFKIDPSGIITFPLIGDVKATGVSVRELRDTIRKRLSRYVVNPQISINVTSIESQKFFILGEVNAPGVFSIDKPITLIEAMASARGFTTDAKLKTVILIRGGLENPELISLDIDKILKDGDLSRRIYIQSGDIVYVPATTIANIGRFFDHLSKIISPIVSMESGYFIGQQIESHTGRSTVPVR